MSGVNNSLNGVGGDFADYLGGDWRISRSRSKQQQIAQWFNTSVFAMDQLGTIGTAGAANCARPG